MSAESTARSGARVRAAPFSEKDFYLGEFRGRTVALAVREPEPGSASGVAPVLGELEDNGTRVVVLSPSSPDLAALMEAPPIDCEAPDLEGRVWRELAKGSRVALSIPQSGRFAATCIDTAVRLGVPKLLFLERDGALLRRDGRRHSFVDLEELRDLVRGRHGMSAARVGLLREIERGLAAGLPAVNLCTASGLAEELFTYEGSGTLFTRQRYVDTRRLGIDDFDTAFDLISRGVSEGYLAPRSEEQVEQVLANGFGAFVEGRYLAGIGALLPYVEVPAAEIASLYTLTRFTGEGVGGHLVAFAVERARAEGCDFVFACTTSPRVVAFFERNGFRPVAPTELPEAKWRGYDADRRRSVHSLRRDVATAAT